MKSQFLNIMKERGFWNQCTNEEGLDDFLYEHEKNGTSAVGYLGSDPTADSLHVGHLVPVMIMRWFQKCGHKPIMLVGGATARIGDPSGKDALRPFLSDELIAQNCEGLKESYSYFIKFGEGKSDSIMVDNYDWFKDVNYIEFLRDIGTHYSVNRMLTMESVKQRLEREQPMSFLEFNYQLFQGYDFCVLNQKYGCKIQLAGADQWGNMISGIELGRRKYATELFGFTSPLLTDANGKKMGKSEGNAIWVRKDKLSSYDYYQYFRNANDADVGKLLRVFTELPMDEVTRLEALKDQEINEAKKILAFEATKLCRGEAEAIAAQETAIKTFEQGLSGDDLPSITVNQTELDAGISVIEAFKNLGLCESNGEVRRLIKQGGAKINGEKVDDENLLINSSFLQNGEIKLSSGKKKHALVKIA